MLLRTTRAVRSQPWFTNSLPSPCFSPSPRRAASVAAASETLGEKVASLCKRRGFVFPASALYGGESGFYDYGPLGVQLKKNVRDAWWRAFVETRADVLGLDTPIILRREVWQASGHLANFQDPLVTCAKCQHRLRADHLMEEGQMSEAKLREQCPTHNAECTLKNLSEVRQFNLLFGTRVGPIQNGPESYLRPETAQGTFINFNLIQQLMRKTLPFGIAQTGKAFRNEISPRDFLFRLREFEQCELEYFCDPATATEHYKQWLDFCQSFLIQYGLKPENIRVHVHAKDELAHYALESADIEFRFPHGWGELWGVANRGDYDLQAHAAASKKDLRYAPPDGAAAYFPFVIEPAVGLDRLVYAFLADAYREEQVGGETRVVLGLDKRLAPYRYAILPLSKQEPLVKVARDIHSACLARGIRCDVDITQSIGKRYRRQDEIGTPQCVTVDFETLQDQCITVRDRDTMTQQRIPIAKFIEDLAHA